MFRVEKRPQSRRSLKRTCSMTLCLVCMYRRECKTPCLVRAVILKGSLYIQLLLTISKVAYRAAPAGSPSPFALKKPTNITMEVVRLSALSLKASWVAHSHVCRDDMRLCAIVCFARRIYASSRHCPCTIRANMGLNIAIFALMSLGSHS
ncbi:uncharacterized protein C8Q71DRAFT_773237 [Rhodofomes roseus]|uniref:Uncharacterized protein n=1 Tax=Rhodofomes roseus TaxID=34475 RepID=A0ABQ8K857_9APHY|nr:uncharacterized protein C8Q71DRAFT_773237 [Rhodofomes roseus]KAH9833404.1 hypothetical protein C8Q71DRAFT_773237 [Rhodofomes roseus]